MIRSRWKKVLLIILVCDILTIPVDVFAYHHLSSVKVSCTDKGRKMMGEYICDKLQLRGG